MNIDYELLQFYVYKKLIKKKQAEAILSECKRLHTPVREYLLTKEYVTEVAELEALSEYYCIPCAEIDMLDVDKSLLNKSLPNPQNSRSVKGSVIYFFPAWQEQGRKDLTLTSYTFL